MKRLLSQEWSTDLGAAPQGEQLLLAVYEPWAFPRALRVTVGGWNPAPAPAPASQRQLWYYYPNPGGNLQEPYAWMRQPRLPSIPHRGGRR